MAKRVTRGGGTRFIRRQAGFAKEEEWDGEVRCQTFNVGFCEIKSEGHAGVSPLCFAGPPVKSRVGLR